MNLQLPSPYRAYVLRCWREDPQRPHGEPVWRFSLQDAGTYQRRSFANLAELATFLASNLSDGTTVVTDEQT